MALATPGSVGSLAPVALTSSNTRELIVAPGKVVRTSHTPRPSVAAARMPVAGSRARLSTGASGRPVASTVQFCPPLRLTYTPRSVAAYSVWVNPFTASDVSSTRSWTGMFGRSPVTSVQSVPASVLS